MTQAFDLYEFSIEASVDDSTVHEMDLAVAEEAMQTLRAMDGQRPNIVAFPAKARKEVFSLNRLTRAA